MQCCTQSTVHTLVQCCHVVAEAPQAVQGTQLAQYRSESSWCFLVCRQLMKPLEAVVLYVGDGQGARVVNLNTHIHTLTGEALVAHILFLL